MKNKDIRKWMRQYVLNELYESSELRNEDLLKVEKGKIVKVHDLIAIGIREYIKSTSRAVVGFNISDMGLSDFKREFINTDEDLKTTLLYGYITQKPIPLRDDEDYILGKEKEGGFKMVDLNLEKINQDEVVDLSEEFDEYVEEMKEEEEEKNKFSERTKSVSKFISMTNETDYKRGKKRRNQLYMTRGRRWSKKDKDDKTSKSGQSGQGGMTKGKYGPTVDFIAKTRGGTSSKVKHSFIKFSDKKELDRTMASISPQSRENMMSRLQQVGDSYQVRMVNASDIFAEYEVLQAQLNEAKADYKKDPTAANEMRVRSALNLMREWKANIVKIIISKGTSSGVGAFKKESMHRYGKDILRFKKDKDKKIKGRSRKKKSKKG